MWKHNPLAFHNNAMPAALAAEAAGAQGKFWEYAALCFENQRNLTPDSFERWARDLGLDVWRWKRDFESAKYQATIVADQQLVVSLGARGTPAFWINGRFLSGAQPFDNFKAVIDEELEKARAAVRSGTPASRYYDQIVATGKKNL